MLARNDRGRRAAGGVGPYGATPGSFCIVGDGPWTSRPAFSDAPGRGGHSRPYGEKHTKKQGHAIGMALRDVRGNGFT